jgi:endonuclease-3
VQLHAVETPKAPIRSPAPPDAVQPDAVQLDLLLGDIVPIVQIDEALGAIYGEAGPAVSAGALQALLRIVVAPGCRGETADTALQRLGRYFPDPERLADADPHRIEALLDPVPAAAAKARRLLALLQRIRAERGTVALPDPVSAAWLQALGLDPAQAQAVARAGQNDPRLPTVDLHHLRAAKRLGLLRPGTGLSAAPRQLQRQVPADWSAERLARHHRRMELHGRLACGYGVPACDSCALRRLCPQAKVA